MSAIETCRTAELGGHVELRGLRAHARRPQFLPQPPLPEVPGRGGAAMARRARGGTLCRSPTITSSLLCRRRSARSRSRTRPPSTTSCSDPLPTRCATIAADPKHLGARIGLTAVLHHQGSALTHRPHVHVIVPGGGVSPDGSRWTACMPGFFLPVRVLSRLFRRLFLERFAALNEAGRLAFFGDLTPLADKRAFDAALAPGAPSGSSTPSDPSPGRKPRSPISLATPTASRSPIPGSLGSTRRA